MLFLYEANRKLVEVRHISLPYEKLSDFSSWLSNEGKAYVSKEIAAGIIHLSRGCSNAGGDRKKMGKLSFSLFYEFHCIFKFHDRPRFSRVVAHPSHDFRFHRALKQSFHTRSIIH